MKGSDQHITCRHYCHSAVRESSNCRVGELGILNADGLIRKSNPVKQNYFWGRHALNISINMRLFISLLLKSKRSILPWAGWIQSITPYPISWSSSTLCNALGVTEWMSQARADIITTCYGFDRSWFVNDITSGVSMVVLVTRLLQIT